MIATAPAPAVLYTVLAALALAGCTSRQQLNRELFDAANQGKVADVQRLLKEGADPNPSLARSSKTLGTPLQTAVAHPDVVRVLLAAGANPNRASASGNTPLILAVELESPDSVQALVDAGANVNAEGPDGTTALDFAIEKTDLRAARILVSHEADVNHQDRFGLTPLEHVGIGNRKNISGKVEAIRLLINHGANPALKDSRGLTAAAWFTKLYRDNPGGLQQLIQAIDAKPER